MVHYRAWRRCDRSCWSPLKFPRSSRNRLTGTSPPRPAASPYPARPRPRPTADCRAANMSKKVVLCVLLSKNKMPAMEAACPKHINTGGHDSRPGVDLFFFNYRDRVVLIETSSIFPGESTCVCLCVCGVYPEPDLAWSKTIEKQGRSSYTVITPGAVVNEDYNRGT